MAIFRTEKPSGAAGPLATNELDDATERNAASDFLFFKRALGHLFEMFPTIF